MKLLLVLLAGIVLGTGLYLITVAAGDAAVEHFYMSDTAVRRRNTETMERFQRYVRENGLASQDTDAISRWSMAEEDVYILFYQNERLALEAGWWGVDADAASEQQLPSGMELYPVSFRDGLFQAIVYDFSESRLYNLVQVAGLVLGCTLLALTMLLYNNRITRQIISLSGQIQSIARGDLEQSMQSSSRDELGSLVRSVDDMRLSIRQKTQEEAEARQKNSELITAMSHDLRNPLTALLGYLGLANDGQYRTEEELRQYIAASYDKAAQLKQLTDRLFRYALVYGSGELATDVQTYDAEILMQQLLGELAANVEQYGFPVRVLAGTLDCSIRTDVLFLKRVTDNLLDNLRKYADPAQPVNLAVTQEAGWLSICVDNAVLPDPDRTQSNCIGLKTCRKIMEQMNGRFRTYEENGRFCAELLLPAGGREAAPPEQGPQK